MTNERPMYYDRDGQPIGDDIEAWGREFRRDRTVARTQIGDVSVSTVFLVLDHNLWGYGPPIIFETMVFGGPNDQYQERYSTEVEALAGHDQIVSAVRAGAVL